MILTFGALPLLLLMQKPPADQSPQGGGH
jgi:hypothetical protein